MKPSMRTRRIQRHNKRKSAKSKLSLVSLMDIFTILVFFLMLNASDVQVLQNNDAVTLPSSTADAPAKETLLLMVTKSEVLLQGKLIVSTDELLSEQSNTIEKLITELNYRTSRNNELSEEARTQQSITIMGDNSVPYKVLKRIMQSCAESGYTNIAMAVENTTNSGSALSAPQGGQ